MKAFKEWEKIEGCPGRETCLNIHCRDCTGERKRGWKAALEFVKSQTVANSFITESMPDTRVIDMKIIEKELTND